MKRFVTSLCLLFLFPVICVAAGCNQSKWVEVQSITYTTNEGKKSLASDYTVSIDTCEVTKNEYDSSTSEQKNENHFIYDLWYNSWRNNSIESDRKNFQEKVDSFVGKTYYLPMQSYENENQTFSYYKYTFNSYKFNYIKVKFISDSVLEIDFKGEQKRVNTQSYDITYFKN